MEEGVVGEPGDPIEGVVVEEELPEGQPGEQVGVVGTSGCCSCRG